MTPSDLLTPAIVMLCLLLGTGILCYRLGYRNGRRDYTPHIYRMPETHSQDKRHIVTESTGLDPIDCVIAYAEAQSKLNKP